MKTIKIGMTQTAEVLSVKKIQLGGKEIEVPNYIRVPLPAGGEKELTIQLSPWEKYGKVRVYTYIPEWIFLSMGYIEMTPVGTWRGYGRGSAMDRKIHEGIAEWLNEA